MSYYTNKCIKYTRGINKRLQKDLKILVSSSQVYKEKNSSFQLDNNSVIYDVVYKNKNGKDFYLVLNGLQDTLYENCKIVFRIKTTDRYPYVPPDVKCITPIYHSNVDTKGNICLDILKKGWLPTLSFTSIAENLSTFLVNHNPDDPLNINAARLMKNDYDKFKILIGVYIKKYSL